MFSLVADFYYSGELRDGALTPPTSYDQTHDLEVSTLSGDRISITGPSSEDQMGEPGIAGIEWADGYVQSSELVSTSVDDARVRTDVRVIAEGGTAPPVGTPVRLDSFAYAGDPEQAFGIPFETVTYISDIGSFPAWLIPGGSNTWVIIVHGKGADLTESLRILPTLHALDFPIMVIHYRNDPGHTDDPSGYHRFGATEWVDVAAAVTYAEEHGSTNHVLVGYSMGGGIVTSYLTQSPLRNRTRAAILDSPILNFEAVVDFQAGNTEFPILGVALPQPLTSFAKWMASRRFDIDWDATDYVAKSRELHAPMLIFHGANDMSVPLATSEELANLRPDIVTLVTTEAAHTRSWNESPEEYKNAILEFLTKN